MNAGLMDHTAPRLSAGLTDPVHDAQQAFRAALECLSRPGRVVDIGSPINGVPLGAAMSHLLLTLTDDDSAVWWQQHAGSLAGWLRFHTGARLAQGRSDAMFAVVNDALSLSALADFAQGTTASPEFSCTVLVEVPSLVDGPALQWRGPGIRDAQTVRVGGLPPQFWSQWQASHAGFPQGVDLFFSCGAQAVGLPRTTRVSRLEEV